MHICVQHEGGADGDDDAATMSGGLPDGGERRGRRPGARQRLLAVQVGRRAAD